MEEIKETLGNILNWEENEKILENINCFVSLEDEILKLYCLVCCAMTHGDHKGYLHKDYLREKIGRLLDKYPIVIDAQAKGMFLTLKRRMREETIKSEKN
jgi:hypothetical protein